MTWDELLAELDRHLRADGARPVTIRDYLDTIPQARTAADLPAGLSVPAAQRWWNAYLAGTFSRKSGEGRRPTGGARGPSTRGCGN